MTPRATRETFRAVSERWPRGEAILIFPEGVSQPEPTLMTLRTGAARLLLDAEAAGAPRRDAPAGGPRPERARPLSLRERAGPDRRAGRSTTAWRCTGAIPSPAVRLLTDRLTEALRRQIVEAEDRETLRLLRVIERVWHEESGTAPEPRSATWLQRASRAYRWLRLSAPAEVEDFRREVEEYADELDRLGVTPETLGRRYAPSVVARYTAREVVPLLLGLPLAAIGMLLHALPYQLLALGIRLARPDADTEATYKLAGGVVSIPWRGRSRPGSSTVSAVPGGSSSFCSRSCRVRSSMSSIGSPRNWSPPCCSRASRPRWIAPTDADEMLPYDVCSLCALSAA